MMLSNDGSVSFCESAPEVPQDGPLKRIHL